MKRSLDKSAAISVNVWGIHFIDILILYNINAWDDQSGILVQILSRKTSPFLSVELMKS